MANKFDNEANQFDDEYFDQDEDDDLGDFIVDSDEEDAEMSKHKHQRLAELEDDIEEEVEEEVEQVEEIEEELEEEEEAPVGQQEILSLREQLKEEIRRKNAAMAAGTSKASCSSSVNQMIMPQAKDGYGTFFGPSKPVLARRVIEEGCSSIMKEQQNVPSRKGGHLVSKVQPGTVENLQKPKFVSEEKRKVDALRENRDYSSLFSDDADTPQPTKEQADNRRPLLVPKSESHVRGPMNSAGMSRVPTGQPARLSSKNHASFQARVHSKAGSPGKDPLADRKRMIASGINGSNQPNMKKKTPGFTKPSSNSQQQPSVQSKRRQASVQGQSQQQPACQDQRMQHQLQSQRMQGNGRQQSLQGRRPDGSVQGQHVRHNGSAMVHGRLKSEQKQLLCSSSKLKAHRPVEKRAVKRKSDDGVGNYSSIIRKIFNYDPEKFGGDEDDRNMEADFASIEREEKRSAALARKEDEEQLRLIQEEERRERAMKKKKVGHKE